MSEFNFEQRQKEKQAPRDEDQRRLAAGEVTRDQLRIENGAFANLKAKPNFEKYYEKLEIEDKLRAERRAINEENRLKNLEKKANKNAKL